MTPEEFLLLNYEQVIPVDDFCECIFPPKPSKLDEDTYRAQREAYHTHIAHRTLMTPASDPFFDYLNAIFRRSQSMSVLSCDDPTHPYRLLTLCDLSHLQSSPDVSNPPDTDNHINPAGISAFFQFWPVSKSSKLDSPSLVEPLERSETFQDLRDTPEGVDALARCASNALEMLWTGLREHVIAILVTDSFATFLYYDHSAFIRSEPLDLVRDWAQFEYVMECAASMTPKYWGYCTDLFAGLPSTPLNPGHASLSDLHGLHLAISDGDDGIVKLGDTIYQECRPRGQGTLVVQGSLANQDVAVKFSWIPSSGGRDSEGEILEDIYTHATHNPSILNHLPKLFATLRFQSATGISTRIKACFSQKVAHYDYEERALHVHVFERLNPLSDLLLNQNSPRFVMEKIIEILKCHKWLYDVMGILHCDVNPYNLMYRIEKGKTFGVLNDFDLATRDTKIRPHPSTLPYASADLISPRALPERLYRHELESFFFTICDLVYKPTSPHDVPGAWLVVPYRYLKNHKLGIIFDPDTSGIISPAYEEWGSCIRDLQILFANIYYVFRTAPSPPNVDVETYGGDITYDKFLAILVNSLGVS